MSYSFIYVTAINAYTFKFEDGFGHNTEEVVANTVDDAIAIFKDKHPETANMQFKDNTHIA
jgi:hypothetical protein